MLSRLILWMAVAYPVFALSSPKNFSFTNPTFGGDPLRSGHLWKSAEKQFEPDKLPTPEPVSELEAFADQLRSRTLSSISSALASKLREISLDEQGTEEAPQTLDIDGIKVDWYQQGNNLVVDMYSATTGEVITLEIPNL